MILGIVCNRKSHEIDTLQSVNHTYLSAIDSYMSAQPLLIPAAPDAQARFEADKIIQHLDGLLVTGNRTNVHPAHYGVDATPVHEPLDEQRDRAAFALIEAALACDLPVLGVCRGMQELNVVCGGTLDAELHMRDGNLDHATPQGTDFETLYAARHEVCFTRQGYFTNLFGVEKAQINSLHRQGIARLGNGLMVEAQTSDGTIEAIRHASSSYCIGVQWHPELQFGENLISEKLFADFDRAMIAYQQKKKA